MHSDHAWGAVAAVVLLAAAPPRKDVSASTASPAVAGDVRCLLLSANYARKAKEEGSRRGAAMTGAFFLGRLDGRVSKPALAAAARALGLGLSAKDAEAAMRACAAHAAAANTAATATLLQGAGAGGAVTSKSTGGARAATDRALAR